MCKFIQKELVSGNEGDQTLVALETIESGAIGPRIRIDLADVGYFRGICGRISATFVNHIQPQASTTIFGSVFCVIVLFEST